MVELKKRLMNNPHHIENILEKYQFHNITVTRKEIRCGIDENRNNTSVQIKLNEKLSAHDYGRDIHGDLFSVIMKCRKVDLKHVMDTVKAELGIQYIEFNKPKTIFGGFYDNIKLRSKNNVALKKYDNDTYTKYTNKYNTIFLKDGISLLTQRKFNIGLCHETARITVPWYDIEGDLVGIEGRYTGDYAKDEISKWFPIIPFPKSQILFGYYKNYEHLQGSDDIYIGESSKFTMQLDSMGIYNSVAVGGNSIHTEQIKQLSQLNPKKIIFCFDEGLDEEVILRQVHKTKGMLKFLGVQIGYVIDRKNEILPHESKNSPSDMGVEKFKELVTKYVEWS